MANETADRATAVEVDEDVPDGNLLADIDVLADDRVGGRYSLDISPAWNVFYTFGGVTMAAAMRAAERELARDDLHPIAAHALFCSPVGAGPIEIDVEVIRDGRSASQVCADLRQPRDESDRGGPALRLLATFGEHVESNVTFQGIEFPNDVLDHDDAPSRPDPAEIVDDDNPFPRINFHHQTDWRPALRGFDWSNGWDEPGEARTASWFRLLHEPRLPDGTIDPVSYCVPADVLGPAVGRRMGPMGPENRPFFVLSLEINLQFLATTESPWTLQHVVAQHAGDGYAFGTAELWDGDRRLIGFATQRAKLRPFTPGENLGPR